jgi:hypothetical protein
MQARADAKDEEADAVELTGKLNEFQQELVNRRRKSSAAGNKP